MYKSISIIIPFKNEARYLKKSLSSLIISLNNLEKFKTNIIIKNSEMKFIGASTKRYEVKE